MTAALPRPSFVAPLPGLGAALLLAGLAAR